jgi:hypothetical protein
VPEPKTDSHRELDGAVKVPARNASASPQGQKKSCMSEKTSLDRDSKKKRQAMRRKIVNDKGS